MKGKVYHELLGVYGRNIFYGNDLKTIELAIRRMYKKDVLDFSILDGCGSDKFLGLSIEIPSKKGDRIACWVFYVLDEANTGTVAHEANHTKNNIFDYLGIDTDFDNDESESYFVDHLVNTFMEKIRGAKPYKSDLMK